MISENGIYARSAASLAPTGLTDYTELCHLYHFKHRSPDERKPREVRTMLVMALKPGHDGSVAVVHDGKLLYALESEKDSFPTESCRVTEPFRCYGAKCRSA